MIRLSVFTLLVFSACTRTQTAEECQEVASDGRVCTMQYDPVCGCNQKTYSNACMAESVGIKKYSPGECAKK